MTTIFIAGTDTDIGKTLITGLLAKLLNDAGQKTITQKWIQCGNLETPDIKTHQSLIEDTASPDTLNSFQDPNQSVYNFKAPVSPHLASQLENTPIQKQTIIEATKALQKTTDTLLIEGSGGLLVPYAEKDLIIDIVSELNLPTLLVAANKVGTINHTLLSLEALKSRNIPCLGIIMTQPQKTEPSKALEDNPKIIEKISKTPILATLSHTADLSMLKRQLLPVVENLNKIKNI